MIIFLQDLIPHEEVWVVPRLKRHKKDTVKLSYNEYANSIIKLIVIIISICYDTFYQINISRGHFL